MTNIPYQKVVGILMYAALGTHLDIVYSVQILSRFSKNSGEIHWKVIKRVFHYLKDTQDLWLTYSSTREELAGFADADGNMVKDYYAILGYAFIINGSAVSWSAKCQEVVILSTTESEYISTMYAAKEAIWLCLLILHILPPMTFFLDNKSAIALVKDH